jgi:serine/threonine protein kinase
VDILKSLHHPFVVKYYDSFIDDGCLNIIMEYCSEGMDNLLVFHDHERRSWTEAKNPGDKDKICRTTRARDLVVFYTDMHGA